MPEMSRCAQATPSCTKRCRNCAAVIELASRLLVTFLMSAMSESIILSYFGPSRGPELIRGVRHGVGQDQPALGVGVDDRDRLARHALDHVARPRGIAVGHVLDQSTDAHHVSPCLAARHPAHPT